MNIHILTAGYGTGHDQAALLLKKAAEKQYAKAVIWRPLEENTPIAFKTSKLLYKQSLKFFPSYWRRIAMGETKKLRPLLRRIVEKLQLSFQKILEGDFILSVHPLLTYIAAEIKVATKSDIPLYHVATDYWTSSITVHPAVNGWYASKIDKLSFVQSGQFLCPAGIPACSEGEHLSKKEIMLMEGWSNKKPLILISGGGEGIFPYEKVLKCIKSIPYSSTIILIGPDKVRQGKGSPYDHHIEARPYTTEFRKYLQAADVLISKAGGLTLAEASLAEVPLIIYSPLPGQEEQNAARFVNRQAAYWAHSQGQIKEKIEELFGDSFLQERWKRRMRSVKQENSAESIISISRAFSQEGKRKEF